MKIGITGATGQLGRLVIENLKNRTDAAHLVALVRTPAKAADFGIEARPFDYGEPSGLPDALQGIDYLLLISGNEIGRRTEQHRNVIDAAKEAGVKWVVYTSLLHADRSGLSLAPEHLATEEMLQASGIPFTLLRNGWYTENYTASVPAAVKAGAFIGSAGNGKISSAARADYAEAAAVVLTSDHQQGKVYELAGDSSYTLSDLAAEITRQTGKNIPYKNLPEAEYAAALAHAGLPEDVAKFFAGFDVCAAENDLFDDGKSLSALMGHPTTPMSASVKTALA